MKKLLAVLLFLSLASTANAAVIEVTGATLVDVGDIVPISVDLTYNPVIPGYSYASYDGNLLSSLNVSLTISGPGTLAVRMNAKGTLTLMQHATAATWDEVYTLGTIVPDVFGTNDLGLIVGDITQLTATYSDPGLQGATAIAWDLYVVPTGPGTITVDIDLFGLTQWRPLQHEDGQSTIDVPWQNAVEGDFGSLTMTVVPEPITMSLLGLGGLALIRRRKA